MKPITILWAILVMIAVALVMSLVIALVNKYLKVAEDPRKEETVKLLPGANCGGCGYPGCNGFADALVKGEARKVTNCVVIKKEAAEEIVKLLNTTPDSEGKTLKTEL